MPLISISSQFVDIWLQPKFEAQFWPETEENYEDLPGSRGKRNPQFSRNNFKTPFNLQEILVILRQCNDEVTLCVLCRIITTARRPGTEPGSAPASTSTEMWTRASLWWTPLEVPAGWLYPAPWWEIPGSSGSNSPRTRNTSCSPSDLRGELTLIVLSHLVFHYVLLR